MEFDEIKARLRYDRFKWFSAGVAFAFGLVVVFALVAILPIQRDTEKTIKVIIEQRDAAIAENAALRRQLIERNYSTPRQVERPLERKRAKQPDIAESTVQ